MATITFIISDMADGEIDIAYCFDPELPKPAREDDLTPAQCVGLLVMDVIRAELSEICQVTEIEGLN